jgi:hypothetical protein
MNHSIELCGLDGSNPLAFLAALGTLRVVSKELDARVSWAARGGAWRPVIHINSPLNQDEFVQRLHSDLSSSSPRPELSRFDDLKLAPTEYRSFLFDAVKSASQVDRQWADYGAAFGSEIVFDDMTIQDTALRTMSGAGHQHFVKFMRILILETKPEHLLSALFQPWQYEDEGPSLRWDPADDRRYALRWHEPSGDPIHTVRGANRLAFESLPLLPTMMIGRQLHTTGFHGTGARTTFWTWPIWAQPAGIDVVRSLLSVQELQKPDPDRPQLEGLGIAEIYRSQRLTIGKYRNFTRAQPV